MYKHIKIPLIPFLTHTFVRNIVRKIVSRKRFRLTKKTIVTMTQSSFSIPTEYKEVVKLVILNEGCIFGGAVRDFLRGIHPNDIDVSIPSAMIDNFYKNLEEEGFVETDDVDKYHKGNVLVHVEELCSDDPALKIDLNVVPDFDVNVLAWDGHKLFDFWDEDYDISDILQNIKKGVCVQLSQNVLPKRIIKMKAKGWTIQ